MVRSCGVLLLVALLLPVHGGTSGFAQDKKLAVDEGKMHPSGKWKMTYDYKIDGKLDEKATAHLRLDIKADRLIGKYEEPRLKDSEAIFSGEFVLGKEGTLLVLRQTGDGRPCVYVGRLVGKDRFAGTWMESKADGLSGEFELTFAEK